MLTHKGMLTVESPQRPIREQPCAQSFGGVDQLLSRMQADKSADMHVFEKVTVGVGGTELSSQPLQRLRLEDRKVKASLGNLGRPCLETVWAWAWLSGRAPA